MAPRKHSPLPPGFQLPPDRAAQNPIDALGIAALKLWRMTCVLRNNPDYPFPEYALTVYTDILGRAVAAEHTAHTTTRHESKDIEKRISSLVDVCGEFIRSDITKLDLEKALGRFHPLLEDVNKLARAVPVITDKPAVAACTEREEPKILKERQGIKLTSGGFFYAGDYHDLTGYPRGILERIMFTSVCEASREEIRRDVWGDDYATRETVTCHASALRDALRAAVRRAGITSDADPLPSKGRGEDLIWKLVMPSGNSTEN